MNRLSLEPGEDISVFSGRSGSVTPIPGSMDADELEYVFMDPLGTEHQCPVCCKVLNCPVSFDQCGHRCCANCLPEILRTSAKCPLDGIPIDRDRQKDVTAALASCKTLRPSGVTLTQCGHRCCANCLPEILRTSTKCPLDGIPIDRDIKVSVDKDFQAEIEALAVMCSFSNKGCAWFGKLKDLQMHIDDCRWKVIPCPKGCSERFERSKLKTHLTEECARREITCDFCAFRMRAEDEVGHLGTCEKFELTCPNNCREGKAIKRCEMEEHLENVCTRQKIKCPFWESGCQHMCKRKYMDKHIKDDPLMHLGMACDLIIGQKREIDTQKKSQDKQLSQLAVLERKVDALEKLYGCQMVWKIENWAERVHEAKLGRKATVFSPPFLTSRHGYKMALALSPHGDGKARGKYLSVFICICKGEYDALLLWPFRHRVAFTLIDQCQDPDARRNVRFVINPNTIKDNKPFLGRPVGDRNASFGAQKFVELSILDTFDYVRDDVIYIKCEVDSEQMMLL